jgi:putative heme-binding domain-containing protein
LPAELAEALDRYGGASIVLGIRRGRAEAIDGAVRLLGDEKAEAVTRIQAAEALGEAAPPPALPALLDAATGARDGALRSSALAALRRYDDPSVAARVLVAMGGMTDDVRGDAASLLASRPGWALALLEAAAAAKVDPRTIPLEAVRRVRRSRDPRVQALARQVWGEDAAGAPAELEKQIERLAAAIRGGTGVPKPGKATFTAKCARCHTLFGEGGKVGPDLTSYQRGDLETMLLSVVRPSAEVREGFETYTAATRDGLVLAGFLVEQDVRLVTLRGPDGRTSRSTASASSSWPRRRSPSCRRDSSTGSRTRRCGTCLRTCGARSR